MACVRHRQSILSRPRHSYSAKNAETADVEYEKAQRLLQAKQERQRQQEEWRRQHLDSTADDKRQLWDEARKEQQEHLALRRQEQTHFKEEDKGLIDEYVQHSKVCTQVEKDHESAKRDYLKEIMNDNLRMIEEKKRRQQEEKERERQESQAPGFFERLPRSYR
eukprot:NODE_1191_length_961_cov_36.197842_g1146_i0.p1 GENE.NODE_1191_length_961_cov_36.197842_g1146_i0~~NODE_1191_length_961_cov_36.197842_g1146_i0.p1  ORF type:complete len:164 (+),score=32.92 NODE_1191_length_961_cov_36.197842_g1146_i0:120-611(+)